MDVEEHLDALGTAKAAVGGTIQTPARKPPYLESSRNGVPYCVRWNEEREAYIVTCGGKRMSFRSAEELLRWCRTEL